MRGSHHHLLGDFLGDYEHASVTAESSGAVVDVGTLAATIAVALLQATIIKLRKSAAAHRLTASLSPEAFRLVASFCFHDLIVVGIKTQQFSTVPVVGFAH